MSESPAPGHNQPPPGLSDIYDFTGIPAQLGDRYSDLERRVREFETAFTRWLGKVTTPLRDAEGNIVIDKATGEPRTQILVSTQDLQDRSIEFLRQIQAIEKEGETSRMEVKRPFMDAGIAIDAWFKTTLMGVLVDHSLVVRNAINAYSAKQLADARRAAAEQAARDAEAAAQIAAAAERTGSQEAMDQAIALEDQAQRKAEAATAPGGVREAASVRTAGGAQAFVNGRYEFKVVNAAKVPRKYCEPVAKLIRDAIATEKRQNGKVAPDFIPGVVIDFVENMTVR